eukprot:7818699-Alexandrium_andersonii.AAC.1
MVSEWVDGEVEVAAMSNPGVKDRPGKRGSECCSSPASGGDGVCCRGRRLPSQQGPWPPAAE